MSFKTTAAPCALLIGACLAPTLAHASEADAPTTVVDSIIVTGRRSAEDPAVVAEARDRLSRTPGAVAVVSAESYADRFAQGFPDTLRNVPGVLARINERFSVAGINIAAQFLQTSGDIGYVVIDVDTDASQVALDQIASIEGTIRCRILY